MFVRTMNLLLPGELGAYLLTGLQPLLVGQHGQDVLVLQVPQRWSVTQLDGQRVLPQHLHCKRAYTNQGPMI